jgi:hypothetical protein
LIHSVVETGEIPNNQNDFASFNYCQTNLPATVASTATSWWWCERFHTVF